MMPPMLRQTLSRLIRDRRVHIVTAILAIYALLGFLLLPYLIERTIPAYAQETLKRQASTGQVRVNPFLLTVELNDTRLQEADGAPIAGFQRLFVDFDISSLFRWAWTFTDIRLDGLDLHLVIDSTGSSNLARLAEALPRDENPPPETAEPPVRLLVQHLRLHGGKFTFSDRSLATPASMTLAPVDLEFHNLSTLPDRQGPYAVITSLPDGGLLVWHGEVSLHPLASSGQLYLSRFKRSAVWGFVQERLRLAPPEGALELFTHYRYAYQDGQRQLNLHGMHVNITDLELRQPDQQDSLLRLERFSARDGRFDLSRRELVFPKVALRNGQVSATLAADGTLDWQRLVVQGPQSATTQGPANSAAAAPWNIAVDTLLLENIAVQAIDLSRVKPLRLAVGTLGVDLRLSVTAGDTATVVADDLGVQLAGIALTQAERAEPLAEIERIGLTGGRVDTGERALEAQQLTLSGASTGLTYDAQGRLDLLEALQTPAAATGASAQDSAAADNPWRLELAQAQIEGARFGFSDQRYEPPLRYDVEDFAATLSDLSNDAAQAARFEASLAIAQGGTLTASGSFAPDGSRAEASLKADNISLKPLKTVVEHHTTLTLQSGAAAAAAQLVYAHGETAPGLRLTGAASIDGLLLDEAVSGDRFLAWNTLATKDLAFSLEPDALTIKQLRVVRPGAKILVFKDRSVNLAKILKPRAEAAPAQPAPSAAADTFPISIERIRIEKGDVDFADMSLVLPFAAKITNLGGTISGISSKATSRANLKLEGRVDEYGSVQVDGGLSPFAPKQYTDISTRFRNIEMTPFSPYTATFAGRKIASGKLSLDLEYKVKDSQLTGDNKILLDQFTLGENIDSPDALDLPLDLAIGLLKDTQGRIDVAVPVTGNVDNPTFSYGKLVGQAIVGMIGKIITAPFRALGSLLGGSGDEDLDSIAFEPGSARLPPPQLETLQKIGQALQQRPQLRLIVSGRYAPEHDGAALRAAHVRRELAAALDIRLDAEEDPPRPAVDQAKTQRELEKLLEARAGKGAADAFQASFEQHAGRPAEPVNPALALFGKASPDADYYQALYARLVELHPLEDSELQALAQQRAAAIVQVLLKDTGLNEARIAAGKIESTSEVSKDGDIVSKLLLEAGDTGTADGESPAPLPGTSAAPQHGEIP
jgi:uncharacterized protein involved in outer membrane biogenesis